MNTFLQFSVRTVISFSIGTSSFIAYLLLFDLGFPLTFLSSLGTGILLFFVVKGFQKRWWLKKNGLSSQEFRYINKNLKEAKEKVKRLQKQQLRVRSLGAFKQILELNRLSRDHKTVFILRIKEGFSIKEIAEITDSSEGTVKSRIFYCVKILAKRLKEFHPSDPDSYRDYRKKTN